MKFPVYVAPAPLEVFVALDTIDLRWSFDRLGALVADRLGREVGGGHGALW